MFYVRRARCHCGPSSLCGSRFGIEASLRNSPWVSGSGGVVGRSRRRDAGEQFGSGLGAGFGQQLVGFRAAFDGARFDAAGTIADEVLRHVRQVRVDHETREIFVAHQNGYPGRCDLLHRRREAELARRLLV